MTLEEKMNIESDTQKLFDEIQGRNMMELEQQCLRQIEDAMHDYDLACQTMNEILIMRTVAVVKTRIREYSNLVPYFEEYKIRLGQNSECEQVEQYKILKGLINDNS